MKTKYIIYALLIIGLGYLIFYRIKKNSGVEQSAGGPPQGGASQKPMTVNGIVVSPVRFANSLTVTGSVDANEQVQIRSEVQGIIRSISFKEGTNVSKGQVLLRIDDSELRAQLAQALTRENLAAETERRAQLLLEKEAISREEYDVALADYRALKAQTQLIRAQLAKTVIRAPFSGKIGLRSVSQGEYLTPTTVVTSLVNINPVKITFSVPEKYSTMVRNNTKLTFTLSGSNEKHTATVYAIEPQVEASTRTLQLRARAANPDGSLIPGSFANIQLPLNTIENAILIPTQSVIPVQNGKKVFTSQNGKAKEVVIETSSRTEKDILVTTGLKEGDTVLTTGIMTLKEGSPVKVITGRK
ncbi:membrane fusion protein (multidrug efflux system) [Arcticibacter tournemirensis]|uniref:Efflux RND transporter periplasmic adaptor subunit n=1 Tax=Arcticibacter tournemirensis TaxID=699437 RepID=A0A5M9HCM2_9SPHI|nr:efflux RND transporter periplasmic adaptor subunit [Arcticibacter tournemirensis]KAA8484672.1 efflux RND transporter periplasmic adaptor subunit [Arcticibacter tournemirensis]TQM47036.1 membrane fusion protein (multidrug efflux system) [Arcticibacter tournemirensis]